MEFPTITSDELTGKLASGAAFVLVDALAPMAYAHSHLPEAINIPPSNVDRARIARRIPDPTTEIVVYCANPDCDDSIETAHKLRELGYTNIRHYAGGKEEWRGRGLPLERAGRPYLPD